MNALEIIRAVALGHGTTADVLRSKQYPIRLFAARCAVYELLRSERNLSYPQIGRLMNRHHTTILNAINIERRARNRQRMHAWFVARRQGSPRSESARR